MTAKAQASTPDGPEGGPVLPREWVTAFLGTRDPDEIKLTGAVIEALRQISPELVPRLFAHPLADHVQKGVAGFGELVALYERATDELEQGAVLDAVDAVQKQYPSTCDLYFGDFSAPEGGSVSHHRSHQNGRDVDIGMYFRDNRPVDTFMPMNEANLDVTKTWCFVENLLRTQRIQYIFLDRKVQKLLYDYALSRGVDETYLNRLFGNSKGAIVQHVVNHQDHMQKH